MTMETDKVKYQLEKAQTALREALRYGYEELSPYQLANITEALKEIDNAGFTLTYQKPSNVVKEENVFGELEKRVNNNGFKWNNQTSFVPAK